MLRNRLYYAVKPFVPWSVRIGLRRWLATRKRPQVGGVWPILPGSETPPAGWCGWPGGKKFACILTHDVEGPEGVCKVKPLAELEISLGFRSCFNFIPEGPYSVPPTLRAWLLDNGFEVAVHDLMHDGKLFASRKAFAAKAHRINWHLREWGAVGFRAGFMLRELDWLHDLQITYDTSTFDTDPFEPQPDHVGTIFPFWRPRPDSYASCDLGLQPRPPAGSKAGGGMSVTKVQSGDGRIRVADPGNSLPHSGYVELPYTLPQDSTLFLILREPSPAIWLHKFDWVARHGGMALVNVHPDYVRFPGEALGHATYPADHYRRLLEHVRPHLTTDAWHPLPKDVAQFVVSQPALQQPAAVVASEPAVRSSRTG